MILYLVIKCGYEGIDELVFPTSNATEATNKVIGIRKQIIELQKKRIEVLEQAGKDGNGDYFEDENCQNAWDRMCLPKKGEDKQITNEEWRMGSLEDPDSYCVMKWDGNKFVCVCKELGVEPKKQWLH